MGTIRLVAFSAICLSLFIVVGGCNDNPTRYDDKAEYHEKAISNPPPPCLEVEGPIYDPSSPALDPGDFSLVNISGLYHVFHINSLAWTDSLRGGRSFGHARTNSFTNWTQFPNIELRHFGSNDSGWSSEHIWAPHVIQLGGTFYMFYTGVDYNDLGVADDNPVTTQQLEHHFEAIGLAKSTDLLNWSFYDENSTNTGKLFDGAGVSWLAWGNGQPYANDCRDPFVFEFGNAYYGMVLSAKQYPENKLAIAYLTATTLESTWYWQYSLDFTAPVDPGHGAESACVTERNGLYYLFWTEACYRHGHDPIIHVATTTTFAENDFTEISVNNLFGFANEITVSDTGDVIFSAIPIGGTVIEYAAFDFDTNSIVPLKTCGF